MKNSCFVIAWLLLCAALPSPLEAQNYSIDWYKVAGGGGTSTNGQYRLSGAIGQPDAGVAMVGTGYSLIGGFWSLLDFQVSPPPLLAISRTATNTAVVFWPAHSPGWILRQNTNPFTGTWTPPAETLNNDGTYNFIVVSPPAGNRFYRLSNR
jgi:hypothetical protein